MLFGSRAAIHAAPEGPVDFNSPKTIFRHFWQNCTIYNSNLTCKLAFQVKIEKPILRIPMLAIHLNRDIDKGFKFNKQTELCPILATSVKAQLEAPSPMGTVPSPPQGVAASGGLEFTANHNPMLLEALSIELGCAAEEIVDMELNVCDTQAGTLGGIRDEFVNVGRLDNQAMCWCSIQVRPHSPQASCE